ncbi:DUF3649 domain-containing protein [uncultured Thiomicrorhabdus sp.]
MNTAQSSFLQHPAWAILSRFILAVIGGYALTNLVVISLVALIDPDGGGALLLGMSLSFILYAAIIIWVYSVRSLSKVWCQFAIASAFFAVLTWRLMA